MVKFGITQIGDFYYHVDKRQGQFSKIVKLQTSIVTNFECRENFFHNFLYGHICIWNDFPTILVVKRFRIAIFNLLSHLEFVDCDQNLDENYIFIMYNIGL